MKKIALCIFSLLIMREVYPHNDGGAFLGGAILGTGLTLAATSGSRRGDYDSSYYEARRADRNRSELRREIQEEQREIRRLKNKMRKVERDLNRSEHFSKDVLENKKNELNSHKQSLKEHQENINDLREELRYI